MRFCTSESPDVFTNLAVEDYLMSETPDTPPTLFLWRSRPAVVIGKHQNPWRECRLREMEKTGVALARRISGGGAVYHDEGNLNYAFFCRRSVYRQDELFDAVLGALADLGITAQRMGKSSLGVDGRKFSGNAFCYRRDAVLHHGTLLVNADLDALGRMLKGRDDNYTTHAVASEPAPVTNLTECRPDLTLDMLSEALAGSLAAYVEQPAVPFALECDGPDITTRAQEMQDTAWCYDRTPAFSVTLETALNTDSVRLELAVRNGRVGEMTFSAPESVAPFLNSIRPIVEGQRLGDETVARQVSDAVQESSKGLHVAMGRWLTQQLAEFAPIRGT